MFEHFDAADWLVVRGYLGGICEITRAKIEHLRLFVRAAANNFAAVLKSESISELDWASMLKDRLLTKRN